MKTCVRSIFFGVFVLALAFPSFAQQKSILFDAAHAQTAGNADWTLDEDSCGIAQRYPTPDQAGITSSTAETYWNGAHSAMGVDLVKKGYHVESLPAGGRFSYGDATNAQDLANYNLLVLPEPNTRYTATEITAIRSFVQNGGGLFLIADHAGADRNNDGYDATQIFNELMGSPSIFGIIFNSNSADRTYGWFDDHPDVNYTADTTSPIIYTGTYGVPSSTKGLGLFGSTSMTLSGSAKGHVWRTVATRDTSSGVTYATSTYGTGRIAAIGDSSVTEDSTNGCNHTTYLGYNDPSYDNGLLAANGIAWIAAAVSTPDTTPPSTSITAPANGATVSGTTAVTASATDNTGVTKVEFYLDSVLRSTSTTSPYSWSWDTTATANGSHTLNSKAYDAANNSTSSAAVTVTVSNVADTTPPSTSITAPANGATVSGTTAVTASATDNVGVTKVEFYLDSVLRSTSTASPYSWSWDTTATANGSHTLNSKAYDAANNSTSSAAVTVTVSNVADTTPPTAPANLTASVPVSGNTKRKLNLSWTASTDNVAVTGYQIWRATSGTGPFSQISTTTTTSYGDSGLISGTTYFYYVKAYDGAGNVSAASNTASGLAR